MWPASSMSPLMHLPENGCVLSQLDPTCLAFPAALQSPSPPFVIAKTCRVHVTGPGNTRCPRPCLPQLHADSCLSALQFPRARLAPPGPPTGLHRTSSIHSSSFPALLIRTTLHPSHPRCSLALSAGICPRSPPLRDAFSFLPSTTNQPTAPPTSTSPPLTRGACRSMRVSLP